MPKSPPARPAPPQTDFFLRVANPVVFTELFDVLPHIFLFIKNRDHRYVKVSRALWSLHGCASEAAMLGHTDFDFNPPALAAQYVEEDRRVMTTGEPLVDQVWLVQSADGMPRWYISSKFPLLGARGAVIGVAGVMRLHDLAGAAPGAYRRLTQAFEFVLANYGEPIAITDLASRAHLSPSQLQREFRRLFGMNPGEYILRVRLLMARRQLEDTSAAVGQIALDCGFYDQSHFTRAFRASTGLAPLEYRRRFTPQSRAGL
ncbi:MAG: AraC family transcriptional regulator [Verrucomicrobiota bacterium]